MVIAFGTPLSTCIVGTEQMSNDLRLVTQQVMLHNKQMFTRDHINEAGTPTEILNRHIEIARTNGRYGHEYHVLALAIVLQRDIYCYSRFVLQDGTWVVPENSTISSLSLMFRSRKNVLGSHILYRVPRQLQKDSYNTDQPCCIFYDMAGQHYAALLPVKQNVLLFKPYTNLFG